MNRAKLARVRELMVARHLDALLLNRTENFAWLTDGAASYINMATDLGAASLLVTPDHQYVVADNIEAPRLQHEEQLSGWEFIVGPWYEGREPLVRRAVRGALGADSAYPGALDVSGLIAPMRYRLDALEIERYVEVGAASGHAVQHAARAVKPGMSENEIAGLIANQAYTNNITPIVVLVATDERIFRFRHPLPTRKKLERYAMLVICGRRWGLVASATRLVYLGRISDEVRHKADACAAVDAAFIRATLPGATLGDAFQAGVQAYAAQGYPDEWRLHHQGGLAGYQPRELLGTPGAAEHIDLNQAFAWNPSISGTKSEDTILLTDRGAQVITQVGDWPTVEVDGVKRPDILQWE